MKTKKTALKATNHVPAENFPSEYDAACKQMRFIHDHDNSRRELWGTACIAVKAIFKVAQKHSRSSVRKGGSK